FLLRADGHNQFIFQMLIPLGSFHLSATTTEKRIIGNHGNNIQTNRPENSLSILNPEIPMSQCLLWGTQPHEFTHPKRLHTGRIIRRLMPKHKRLEIYQATFFRQHALGRRIKRVTGSWRQHYFGRLKIRCPVTTIAELIKQLGMLGLTPHKTVNGPHKIWKVIDMICAAIMLPVENRRE